MTIHQTTLATTTTDNYDWKEVLYYVLLSRILDRIEEKELVPLKKVFYQFSAKGHDLAQVLLAANLNHPHDGACGYYRSRPFILATKLPLIDAVGSPLAVSGGYSNGRDIGVVCNNPSSPCVFPMQGGVGAQFTPVSGWAQSILYYLKTLNDPSYQGAIAVSLAGDAAMATGGFWSALNIATTLKLPQLFFIEDNGYGISVPTAIQTPNGNFVENLKSYQNLKILDGKGYEVEEAALLIQEAVSYTRTHQGPCLLRLKLPRLCGHAFQDNQKYKSESLLAEEKANDPLPKLQKYLVPNVISQSTWEAIEKKAEQDLMDTYREIEKLDDPDIKSLKKYVYSETGRDGKPDLQKKGGLWPLGHQFPASSPIPTPMSTSTGNPITMLAAIRLTLEHELKTNEKLLVFGEDVGHKGGVYRATSELQKKYGEDRVFDTSLNEEGIIGRAVGMAYSGLMPVAEIQFRKYAEPATEQINDCGTVRWRTFNRFAAPMVVRIPGGYERRADPWHALCNEVEWAHQVGWQVAYPSNVEDAVGLLRNAMRDNNPTIFFEHRALYNDQWSRRPYPSDQYLLKFGQAKKLCSGSEGTIISWGATLKTCELSANEFPQQIEVIDLRTISPWDKETVVSSVNKTGRCLIVHEDNVTAGFGAEIAATVAKECFQALKSPVERLAMPDIPPPHQVDLFDEAMPSKEDINAIVKKWIDN